MWVRTPERAHPLSTALLMHTSALVGCRPIWGQPRSSRSSSPIVVAIVNTFLREDGVKLLLKTLPLLS